LASAYDDIGPVLVELSLGGADSLGEVLVREGRVEDFVAVLRKEGRFDAAWDGVPAVEAEDSHKVILFAVGPGRATANQDCTNTLGHINHGLDPLSNEQVWRRVAG
jgi:hypothetical protein